MFRAAVFALLLSSSLLAACTANSATNTYSINGYVTDVLTSAPIAGVHVTFTSDTLYRAEATTDSDGLYEMTATTDTPFGQVRAEVAGYQSVETTVLFDTPERRLDLSMRPGTDPVPDAGM